MTTLEKIRLRDCMLKLKYDAMNLGDRLLVFMYGCSVLRLNTEICDELKQLPVPVVRIKK